MKFYVAEPGPELLGLRKGSFIECRVLDPGTRPTSWHIVGYCRSRDDAVKAIADRQSWADQHGTHLEYRVAG